MIRPIENGDLEWIRKERNRPECRQWFRQDHIISQDEQYEWFETTSMRSFVVVEDDVNVGVVSLSHVDTTVRKCEFSIMITPEFRGRGYGRKALNDLLDHAFNDLNMRQVYSDVFENNPSRALYKDIGFRECGILPDWYYKNGTYVNTVVIVITKDEYNRLK